MHQHTKILLKSAQMILRNHDFFFTFQIAIGHYVEFLKA